MAKKAHPGFASVARGIAARQGISLATASKELASSTRHASRSALSRNPRLKRVARGKGK